MKIKPGYEAEYERRHREIWPEIVDLLKKEGVYDYSIFLDKETNTLFAYQKTKEKSGSQDLGGEEAMQRWWAFMADIMETNPDLSPISTELKEVFYLD